MHNTTKENAIVINHTLKILSGKRRFGVLNCFRSLVFFVVPVTNKPSSGNKHTFNLFCFEFSQISWHHSISAYHNICLFTIYC